MKLEEIKELMKAMEENDISSFEYNEGDLHLSFRRGAVQDAPAEAKDTQGAKAAVTACAKASAELPADNRSAGPAQPADEKSAAGDGKLVTSPLVGTFYAADAPDKEPFVKVGDTVKKGQILGIIEAMKLMNEIESDYDGVVKSVLVNNEEVVEYGQPLFCIE
ncbi:MAG: acetyl-CoA carboxylase biotin carboxyl carrier protein [Eubacteriales bacterium]|nr:acetyl-CoA carboxylase biotin carboxyl carrier protein [Eubacteriales bacterium]